MMTSDEQPVVFRPMRVQTILDELNKAADDYAYQKEVLDRAQVEFEAARERFASVKALAGNILTTNDLWEWTSGHLAVRYAAMPLADAIDSYLVSCALDSAVSAANQIAQFDPYRDIDQITGALEDGGFEFRTTSPKREVNGALTNLAAVEVDNTNRYKSRQADDIYAFIVGRDKELGEQSKTE